MTVQDIISAVEEFAPLCIQESWDNSGLIIGRPQDTVSGVMLGFDCTRELVEAAVAAGCNMVITHHPLIFKGIRSINEDCPVGAAISAAIRSGVAVYAAHTTADKVREGVSGAMAAKLGLQDVTFLEDGPEGFGLGCIGNLAKPVSGGDALAMVKEAFGLKIIRSSKPIDGPISRVAVLGGSGGGEIGLAMRAGAQLYISADISYHDFFVPEGFMVMDIGHFESEVEIVGILMAQIRKKFPNFAVCIEPGLNGSNPVHYYV